LSLGDHRVRSVAEDEVEVAIIIGDDLGHLGLRGGGGASVKTALPRRSAMPVTATDVRFTLS
jgi:hypothetical protein